MVVATSRLEPDGPRRGRVGDARRGRRRVADAEGARTSWPGRSCSESPNEMPVIESAGGERTGRREATLRYLITR